MSDDRSPEISANQQGAVQKATEIINQEKINPTQRSLKESLLEEEFRFQAPTSDSEDARKFVQSSLYVEDPEKLKFIPNDKQCQEFFHDLTSLRDLAEERLKKDLTEEEKSQGVAQRVVDLGSGQVILQLIDEDFHIKYLEEATAEGQQGENVEQGEVLLTDVKITKEAVEIYDGNFEGGDTHQLSKEEGKNVANKRTPLAVKHAETLMRYYLKSQASKY